MNRLNFQFSYKVGQDYVVFVFPKFDIHWGTALTLMNLFERLGGILQSDPKNSVFHFPLSVTPQVVKEVIRNTCFNCGGLMKGGQALDNTLISYDDFGGDAGNRGTTQSKDGEAKLIKVRKCQSCGHSHTI